MRARYFTRLKPEGQQKEEKMIMFRKAQNESAYLKAGILGFAGSGKSRTSSEIAVGLHRFIKSEQPVFYLDTETGSDFLLPFFKKNDVELFVSKSRAFVDLKQAVKEAEKVNAILIIDSISHFWNELMESFKKKRGIDRLFFQHWAPIKEEWREFTDLYVNSKCHIIMAGRAGYEYDYEKDADGVNELVKTGTKMKAETEMGYEPSLLIEMEKVKNTVSTNKIGGNFTHRAWIIKDRFDTINGKCFDNPTFESFLPHISLLNIGGEHVGIEADRNSQELFNGDGSAFFRHKQKDILLEELDAVLTKFCDSRSAEGKKARIEILETVFGSSSKTKIEMLDNVLLEDGLNKIKEILSAERSRKS